MKKKRPPSEDTQKTRDSMFRRLTEKGFNLETLSQDDYPYVKLELGWAESTFKAALKYLGRDHESLYEGFNSYLPSSEEEAALREEFGAFFTVLSLLGCRFSEMWTLVLDNGFLVVDTQKKGEKVTLRFDRLSKENQAAVYSWVKLGMIHQEAHKPRYGAFWGLTPKAVRKRWDQLKASGKLTKNCTPHCFRHKLISEMINSGTNTMAVAKAVGHKSIQTTFRYAHCSPDLQVDIREKVQKATKKENP